MKILFVVLGALLGKYGFSMDRPHVLDARARELYLTRLGLAQEDVAGEKNEELLIKLVQHNLVAIPFENLTMHASPLRDVDINHDAIINKVLKGSLGKMRGGYCYEVNELFYLLLKTLGFNVTRHKASVWAGKASGEIPVPSHQMSLVKIGDDTFLADVGFGLFNIFQAIKLPREIGEHMTFTDSQGKRIMFERVRFDASFGLHQAHEEGFVYSRFSESKQSIERVSSFSLKEYDAEDFSGHNNFVQKSYKPFLDNVMFTRFTKGGAMIACVKARTAFTDMDDILAWINASQGDDADFVIDVRRE